MAVLKQRYKQNPQRYTLWQPPTNWVPVAPGVWHPPDYTPNKWEQPSPIIVTQEDAIRDWFACKNSLAYFAFHHCWSVHVDDPQEGIAIRKIPAYPYLRRFFNAVQEPKNIHVEKSRQMLLSWAWMVTFLWDVLFHENFPALVMSKRAKDVDKGGEGDFGSNFGKIIFIHQHLPEHLWLPMQRKQYNLYIPATGSNISGETGKGGQASRGPAYKRALMDEAAYIERSDSVFKGIRQAAKTGTALNSTPNGADNVFYRIRHSKTTTFLKLRFHWSEHPEKSAGLYCVCGWQSQASGNGTPLEQFKVHELVCPRLSETPPKPPEMRSPFYDKESADMTPENIASELDISYERSRRGRVFTHYNAVRNVFQAIDRLGPRGLTETLPEYQARYLRMVLKPNRQYCTSWDIAVGDPTGLCLWEIVDDAIPKTRLIDCYLESDKSYKFFADIVNSVWKQALIDIQNPYDMLHYGGQDTKNRDSKLESWFTNLRNEGIVVKTGGKGELLEWIDFLNDWYLRGNIEISDWCDVFFTAIQNYHYPTDDAGELIAGKHLPDHDWSDLMDSKRYLFKVRYPGHLYNRDKKGIKTTEILRRGSAYDTASESRKF